MHLPDPEIPNADVGIAGTKANGLLLERDRLLYRPDVDLASTDMGYCARPIAIGRERRLVFADRLLAPTRGAQELAFGPMRKRAPGRRRQGLPYQPFRAGNVRRGGVGHFVEHAAGKRAHQPGLRLDRPWIDRQRALEQTDRLCIVFARFRFRPSGACPENVIQRVGMFGRPSGLGCNQLSVERQRDAPSDLVL
jgi:hypothetical protein